VIKRWVTKVFVPVAQIGLKLHHRPLQILKAGQMGPSRSNTTTRKWLKLAKGNKRERGEKGFRVGGEMEIW